jgi:menaquinone-9 beta-reductase
LETDVLIVGGGPAGLATAIASRQKGLRAFVLDCRVPPIDKPCGEGLLPEGVAALRVLGVELNSQVAAPLAGLEFFDGSNRARAEFRRGQAWGVRRTTLHQLLLAKAVELGVNFEWGAKLSELGPNAVRLGSREIRPRWLVGADGVESSVRKAAGIRMQRGRRARFGFRRHYATAPWSNFVEVYWAHDSQLSVTPTGANEICVSLLTTNPLLRVDRAIELFPGVAARLNGATPTSPERGAVIATSWTATTHRGSAVLVGDAGGTVDAITGLGVGLAFQQALALADALSSGDLKAYQRSHAKILRIPRFMNGLLLAMSALPMLRNKVLKLFASHPNLFREMLSAHTEATLTPTTVMNLGWRILWA